MPAFRCVAHDAAELKRNPVSRRELQIGNAVDRRIGQRRRLGEALRIKARQVHESDPASRRNVVGRVVGAEKAGLIVFVETNQRCQPPRQAAMAGKRGMLAVGELQPFFQLCHRRGDRGRAQSRECQCGAAHFIESAIEQGVYGNMTVKSRILRALDREDVNFVLTNRLPRRVLNRFAGWFSRIEQPLVRDLSIDVWRFFSDLDLSEARDSQFRSMHDCFTRRLKPGARPIDQDPNILVSPCDAIVGAHGAIRGTDALSDQGRAL